MKSNMTKNYNGFPSARMRLSSGRTFIMWDSPEDKLAMNYMLDSHTFSMSIRKTQVTGTVKETTFELKLNNWEFV